MKSLYLSLFAIVLPFANASAALVYDFESLATDVFRTGATNNISGWQQNTSNPTIGEDEFPLGYIGIDGSNHVGTLGTHFTSLNPFSSTTSLTGSLTSTGATLNNTQVTLDLALLTFNGTTPHDAFSLTIGADGFASAASLSFTPDAINEAWLVSYDINGSTGTNVFSWNAGISYALAFDFYDSATFISIGGSVIGSTTSTFGNATLENIIVSHLETPGPGVSDNVITFDNISVTAIPEPSIAALGAIGSLALLRRRRQG